MAASANPAILKANSSSLTDLNPSLPSTSTLRKSTTTTTYSQSLARPDALSPARRAQVWRIYEENMMALTKNTSLYEPKQDKLLEMFHPLTVFVLLTLDPSPSSSSSDSQGKDKESPPSKDDSHEGDLLAYASIRFDDEETMGDEMIPVVYIYEMQVSKEYRGLGLGSILLEHCETLGRSTGMRKAMLTCLKNNSPALTFYNTHAYQPDEIDPTRVEINEHHARVQARLKAARAPGGGRGRGKGRGGKGGAEAGGMGGGGAGEVELDQGWWKSVEVEVGNGKGPDYRILSKEL